MKSKDIFVQIDLNGQIKIEDFLKALTQYTSLQEIEQIQEWKRKKGITDEQQTEKP